jgi:hypothetical protein
MGLKILIVILFIFIILNRERYDYLIRKMGKKYIFTAKIKSSLAPKDFIA